MEIINEQNRQDAKNISNSNVNITSRPSKKRHRIFHIDLRDELVMKI